MPPFSGVNGGILESASCGRDHPQENRFPWESSRPEAILIYSAVVPRKYFDIYPSVARL